MKRWNGWGDDENDLGLELSPSALAYLQQLVGPSTALPAATLEEVLSRVPPSRLPPHTLVSVDAEDRVRHARGQSLPDWLALRSGDFGVFPDGVAFPKTSAEVGDLLQYARQHQVSVIPYGGGTSVVGHINPEAGGRPVLTIDMTGMNRLIALDRESQIATFGAGANGPQVESALAQAGYTLGHYPQSWELSTVGGWVASRSSGQQSMRYGRIEQMFAGGHIETPMGSLEIPSFPASSAGPDIREMIMGSEGRMGIITEVKVRVTPLPERESFHVIFFPDWDAGLKAVRAMAQGKVQLSMMRLSNTIETFTQLKLAGGGTAISLLEKYLALRGVGDSKTMFTFGVTGSRAQCKAALALANGFARRHGGVGTGTLLGRKWEHGRFRSPYLREGLWDAGYAVDTMETAIDWIRVPDAPAVIEAAITGALAEEKETVHAFTHLSHIYPQGSSVYTTYIFRCGSSYAQTHARWQQLKAAGARAIVELGGTISHQHGVGKDHAMYLPAEKGELGIAAIQGLVDVFDPQGQMNPGKLLP
ncbi:MAG: FAD-binding oxidoreductase [Gammaproteobacteria bacterium]|jgi:alkyldihydroxyacetonephosphate synthase|nr:FAD-binding oxidoreductase [Gammaproteobacteria bacterium]MDH5171364.1 FAD-binding oxidoreductase [Gammaproteobacteria bacterium]